MSTPRTEKAFTLVELSIVIVIIGLLVGGVVAGKNIVKSAQLRSVITDVNSYKVAVSSFKLQYNALPGDMSNAYSYWGAGCGANTSGNTDSCNGNNDRRILSGLSTSAPVEDLLFWKHLKLAGLISGSYTGVTNGAAARYTPNSNTPGLSISGGTVVAIYGPYTMYSTAGNSFMVASTSATGGGWVNRGDLLTPAEASSIDAKVDDGLATAGHVYGLRSQSAETGGAGCINQDYWGQKGVGVWVLADTLPDCNLVFWF